MNSLTVCAFYKFVALPRFEALRPGLRTLCAEHGIRGTILLAPEGINGTIAGEHSAVMQTMAKIRDVPEFADLDSKQSHAHDMPFRRMKVRLKKEIVTLGVPGVEPASRVGAYIAPEDWNDFISDPEVLVIDTRNGFEVERGSFTGALDPKTRKFSEFPRFVGERLLDARNRKIAMYCTGGIRCEKATSYLLQEGFKNVFHLKGGILKYLETVPEKESLWRGSCFVFDERAALGHGLGVSGEGA